jgi:methyl-accepting chemotaxis protein
MGLKFFSFSSRPSNAEAILAAINRTQAIIQFDVNGNILDANANFLAAMGYTPEEIKGKHHSMFVESDYAKSAEYATFWEDLRHGKAQVAQFKRLGKGGREVWIEASYNPILDGSGKVVRVVKYATDVSKEKAQFADLAGQVEAIGKSQAVITFALDGTILDANANFLAAMGYTLSEIKGKHHSMFIEPDYARSAEYARFWERLRAGEYQSAQYKRLGKGGREVWIQASYNPILDLNGKPMKVVKYATDITKQIELLSNLKVLIDQNFAEVENAINRTRSQAENAAHDAEATSNNVETVASASEELAASIAEISRSMSQSRMAADSMVDKLSAADAASQRLTKAAGAMTSIVELIQTIAGKINLLALNATIESARAGDAGKGFAVVANEVKILANQAAKATEQITSEIGGVQDASSAVVRVIEDIRNGIAAMRDYVAATAAAVEQQSAVTRDMSANMQEASTAVVRINTGISEISVASTQAGHAIAQTKEAAGVLQR